MAENGAVWIQPDRVQKRLHMMCNLTARGLAMDVFALFCEGNFQPFAFDAEAIARATSSDMWPVTPADVLSHRDEIKKLFDELQDGRWTVSRELYSPSQPEYESDEEDALLPQEVIDLRGMEWMPLHGDRLFTSDTWLHASAEARNAALKLWWESWKQCPAGSLPNSDIALAQLAGYGMMVAAWCAVREEALHGWILRDDGRIYHPVVCDLAAEAAGFKEHHDARQSGVKRRKQQERNDRKRLFAALRERGIVLSFKTPTAELRRIASEAQC